MMVFSIAISVLALALALQFQLVSAIGTNDQVNANIYHGTFSNPSIYVRPRLRYWTPDASVNLTQVTEDVRAARSVGAGGVELLGYYIYGNIELFHGLLWDLDYGYAIVPIGGIFDGVLPGWNSGQLVSASNALVLDIVNFTSGGSNTTLAQASLTDITGKIASDGTVKITFGSEPEGIEYRVIAYYLKHSLYPEIESTAKTAVGVPQSPITTYQQNGSWVADHFSILGAQTTIDF